jgi:hypothetical protein
MTDAERGDGLEWPTLAKSFCGTLARDAADFRILGRI